MLAMGFLCDDATPMIHASPIAAFVGGSHVEVIVDSLTNGVYAKPIQPSVPCAMMLCDFPSWVSQYLQVGSSMTICHFQIQAGPDVPVIRAKEGDLLPILHAEGATCRVAEAFAGLGGWSFGLSICRANVDLMVEIDSATARAAAESHRCILLDTSQALKLLEQGHLPTPVVLRADIKDHLVWVIAGFLGVGWWAASPPCPPWSTAASQLGLDTEDGELLLQFIAGLGLSRAFGAMIENVPGLPKHKHYAVIKATIKECGLNLIIADTKPAFPALPVERKRWLAACIRHDVEVDHNRLMMANNMGVPHVNSCCINPCNMAVARCVQEELQDWEREACIPSQAALDLMSKADLLPESLRNLCSPNASAQEVLGLRTRTPNQPLQPIMARQGSQHQLPISLLQEKGLYAYVLDVNGSLRYTTPYEVASCMGFPSSLVLPSDIRLAWQMVGNALTIMHAAWHYMRVWPVVAATVALPGHHMNNHDLCIAIDASRCQLQDFQVCRRDDLMELRLKAPEPALDLEPPQSPEDESDVEPSPKRLCISPTWEFEPMEVEDNLVPVECHEGHIGYVRSPKCAALSLAACVLDPPPANEAIPVRILHAENVWVIGFFTVGTPRVCDLLLHVLPHANADHFNNLWLNNRVACFTSRPSQVDFMSLVFQPVTTMRIVHATFLHEDVSIAVDVTWKLSDMVAYVAAKANVLPSQVGMHHQHSALDLQSFVLAHDLLVFDCELLPQLAESLVPKRRGQSDVLVKPVVPPPVVAPVLDGLRFTTVDQKWGTVKSVCLHKESTVEDMLCKLLPSYCATSMPVLSTGDIEFFNECRIMDLPPNKLEISFPDLGFPVVPLVNQCGNDPWTPEQDTMLLWIKGPFEHRARITKIPVVWNLLQIASHCLKDVSAKVTLMVLQGGRGMDPLVGVQYIDPNQTIEFRACSLPGGAKQNDVVGKLKKLLADRGVPEPALAARAALITGKISASELQPILSQEAGLAWNALKKKATEAKLRLVTSQELHDFQRQQRDKKQATSSDAPAKAHMGPKKSKPQPPAVEGKLTIDIAHFHCEQGPLTKLDIAQWGPDQTGVAIASVDEAMKLLPVTNLAVQPLALVVITPKQFASTSPVTVPATREDGQPTLASVVLLNYGDALVTCQPRVPKIDLAPVPTSILEVFIERHLTTCWDECQCPLTYLGQHLPEIRKQQVIASWAFSPYNSKRAKCRHDEAEYWHGFVKIPEEHLSATLRRSGLAGIFILVRTPEKRLDGNFGTVPLHGHTLEEVINLSRTVADVLGVVQMGRKGPFALRGKRDNLAKIRLQAVPQGITLQEGSLLTGGSLWTLRNVRTSTTCQKLTDALARLGWSAHIIKPIGRDAWLASAKDDPPATHLCIGDDYVAVAPLHRTRSAALPHVTPCNQADLAGGATDGDSASVSTRLSDIKCDLEERLSAKFSTLMETRFKECDDRITQLADTVEEVKQEVTSATSSTQKQLEDQSAAIQAQLKGSNDSILQQMQSLFSKMQSDLQATMSVEPAENKRAKLS
eukprot:Skav220723  [mRNA]  locus=scaffold2753:91098:95669:- [translate_table: standard]